MKTIIVAFLLFALATCTGAQDRRFENEIRAFELADSLTAPQLSGIVLWGSSSFRFWGSCQTDLAPYPVINRGFGGSEMTGAVHFFTRAVLPHRPSILLIYEGDNDLDTGKKTPQEVLANFQQLVKLASGHLPDLKIGFVAIKPSPLRASLLPQQRVANGLIRQFCQRQRNLAYIDIATPMLNAQGQPRPELFLADQLHLSPAGYQIWAQIIQQYLKKNYQP